MSTCAYLKPPPSSMVLKTDRIQSLHYSFNNPKLVCHMCDREMLQSYKCIYCACHLYFVQVRPTMSYKYLHPRTPFNPLTLCQPMMHIYIRIMGVLTSSIRP